MALPIGVPRLLGISAANEKVSFNFGGRKTPVTAYVRGIGDAITAGTVLIEAAEDEQYAGDWTLLGTIDVTLLSNKVKTVFFEERKYNAVRLRISDAIVGGTVNLSMQV